MISNDIELKSNYEQSIKDRARILKLYDMIAHDFILNYENLLVYGFTEFDIQKLIDEKVLFINNNGVYDVLQIGDLTGYGIKQLLAKRYIFAKKCISKCYSLSVNKRQYLTKLLLILVKNGKYHEAMKVYSHLEILDCDKEKTEEYYNNTNIMYLYLLNMLTVCDERYQNIINDFDQDIILKEIRGLGLSDVDNEIRKCIILNKFKYAFQLIRNKIKVSSDYTIDDQLLQQLLFNTVNLEEKYKNNLLLYLEMEEYQKMLDLFDERRQHRYLNNQEMYAYLVIENIINIRETGIIPMSKISNTTYLYDAIKNNNFSLAQELNRKFLKRKNKSYENDLLDMLLVKINEMILEIKLDVLDDDDKLSKEEQLPVSIQDEEKNKDNLENTQEQFKEILFAEEMAYYIKSQIMSVDEAKKKFGISNSQILLIKLIYARDYFIDGMDELGNKLLKEVEKSNEKNDEVIELLDEIRRDKRFYKNRTNIKLRKRI